MGKRRNNSNSNNKQSSSSNENGGLSYEQVTNMSIEDEELIDDVKAECSNPTQEDSMDQTAIIGSDKTSADYYFDSYSHFGIHEIHSKRRNRLAQARLNDLVYVKYNRALMKRFEMRHKINPIKLKDIDESNEWLTGIVDEDVEAENERVFGDEDDDLTWGDVAQATGVHEQRFNMRPRISGRNDNTSRTAASSSISSRSRTQPTIVVEDDNEDEEEDDKGYQSNLDSDGHSSFEEDEDDE